MAEEKSGGVGHNLAVQVISGATKIQKNIQSTIHKAEEKYNTHYLRLVAQKQAQVGVHLLA